MNAYEQLQAHLATVQDVYNATALLEYDQQVHMPPGASASRARTMATMSRLAHEIFVDEKTKTLLQGAAAEIGDDDDSDAASLVRVVTQDYEDNAKLPADFVAEYARESALAHEVWVKARAEKDFSQYEDTLKRLIDLAMREAEFRGYDEHPYDALLNKYERGMTTAQVKVIFDAHRPALIDLITRISEAQQVDDSVLHQPFDTEKQRAFGLKMVEALGFDFHRGMQAVSVHPFCINFGKTDVRITTRFEEDFLNPALFGMFHEAGHGMYEQGIDDKLDGTLLGSGTSLGVHESQSRMWENIVGRSRNFWSWALPQLKDVFPQVADVTLDEFYRAINKVERSFIRVEADEATYNLHIILRFELELDLLSGELAVADLPEAWNSRFEQLFGIVPPNAALGVLQDVHWSAGLLGYFPTYALGNMLSVQYYNQALRDHPEIDEQIAEGQFATLLTWLNENIHRHGRKYTGDELTRRVTGEGIQSQDYMQYLTNKFSDVYGLK